MNLKELQPKEIKFEASDLSLTFRAFTIADDLKAQELLGSQEMVGQAFETQDFAQLSLLAWYQLTIESQREVIAKVEGNYIDPETGEETPANFKPIEKFRSLFWSAYDRAALLINLLNCRGLNIPDLEDEEGLKKWMARVTPILTELTGQ